MQGQPPASSGTPDAPTITGGAGLETGNGEQTVLEVGYESPSGYVDCYVQVIGADDYFLISAPSSATTGVIQIPVNIPANVSSGIFDFYTCISGENGGVSNPITTSVDVTYTGSPGGGGGGNVICASDDPSVGSIIPCPQWPVARLLHRSGQRQLLLFDRWKPRGVRKLPLQLQRDRRLRPTRRRDVHLDALGVAELQVELSHLLQFVVCEVVQNPLIRPA